MKWRNLAIVAAVFAALGAYVYFYEIKGEKKREEAAENAKKLFAFESKDVAVLTIHSSNGEITLEKVQEGWKISKPLEAKADKFAADGLASDLASLKIERTLEDEKPQWTTYGLESPQLKVTAKLSDGKTHELEFGEKDFTDFSIFARVPGQDKVLVLPTGLFNSANKKLLDFRDKTVVEFQRDQLKEFTVAVKGKEFTFEKNKDDWMVKKPFQARADNSEVNSVVSDLESAKAEDFVDAPTDLKAYGLSSPDVRVDLYLGDNRTRRTLLIGKKVDSSYYAKDDSRSTIFKIREDLFKKLDLDSQKIRDKKMLRVERADVNRIEVTLPDKTFAFFKGSDDRWKMSRPEGHQGKYVTDYKIFWPIEDLEGKELIDNANLKDPKYGFDKPSAEIHIVDKNQKTTEIKLGKVDEDKVFGVVDGGTTVYKVEKKVLDDLNFKPEDLIEK
ncbi:MAG: DUF4340 domain-containing protein [Acidobacteriota bacterium]